MMFCKGISFRDTTIGKIPKDWEVTSLQEVALDLVGGGTPSTSNPEYWDGEIAWMTSAHINSKNVTSGQRYITKKGLENSATNLIPKDNLLIATRVGIGKAAINDIDVAISQDLTGVIVDTNKALPEFLYWYIINSGRKLKSLAQGSTIKGILREDLGRLLIPHLPLPEQKAIVGVLGVSNLAIAKTGKVIAKTERLKKGLMQELLTKGIGHKEYKQTPIGKTPKTWEIMKLEDVAIIERGKFAHRPRNEPRFYGGNIPFIQTGDIAEAKGLIKNHTQTLNEEGLKISKMFKKGTIVVSIAGNIGDVGILDFDACFPDSVIGISVRDSVDAFFLMYVLQNLQHEISAKAPRSTQKNINLAILNSLIVPIPPMSEQRQIATILSNLNKKLELERKEKMRLEKIKQGLMDLLLTGKVRVKVD